MTNLESAASVSHPGATRHAVAGILVAWLALAILAAGAGILEAPPGEPPLALLAFVLGPVLLFLAAYGLVPSFRSFVLGSDLRLLTMLQAWRMGGFLFLVLLAYGLLPGLFAWPAGLGDMAIGLTAPVVALALIKRPAYAATAGFVTWNMLGILDFVVAVGTGVATGGLFPALARGPGSASMAELPLSLIPSFLVPLFTILHLTAILHARRMAAVNRASAAS